MNILAPHKPEVLLHTFVLIYSEIFTVYWQGQYWTITLTTAVHNIVMSGNKQNRILTNKTSVESVRGYS